MAEIAILMVFDTRLKASVEIQCGIDLSMMGGYNLSSIILVLFTATSPLRTSATLRKHMWATMDQRYLQSSFQFQFALIFNIFWSVNEILAFYPNHFLRWSSRRLDTPLSWKSCIAKNVWIFHIIYSFYGRKEWLPECSDVWSRSP